MRKRLITSPIPAERLPIVVLIVVLTFAGLNQWRSQILGKIAIRACQSDKLPLEEYSDEIRHARTKQMRHRLLGFKAKLDEGNSETSNLRHAK